jgi:hypothetical protein
MVEELDFKISSGLKNIIGKELITSDRIAIFELLKNSYDANASVVKIIFQHIEDTKKSKAQRILIVDDGEGMSREELIGKFLFVGYSEKRPLQDKKNVGKDFRDKQQKRRIFAGAKGVGRFSCDRLGRVLKLYTKKMGEKGIHTITINWDKFEEDQKKEFQTIKVNYEIIDKIELGDYNIKDFTNGTILEITSLNSEWGWNGLIDLKMYLQRLINPAQVNEKSEFKIILEAEEYKEDDKEARKEGKEWNIINGHVKNLIFEDLGIKTTEIKSTIDDEGKNIITELVDKEKFIFRLKEKSDYSLLKNINIKFFYLNKEAKQAFTRIMGIQPVQYGSVFLYKNGVRIHPYGDEGDDWLGLEKRKGQGYARNLSNRELLGRIEISGNQPSFIEVSSREGGIVRNEHYVQLVNYIIKKVLRRLERYVVEGIDWEKEESTKTDDDIKRDSLELIQKITGQVKDPEKEIEFNKNLLDIVEKKEIEKIPELIKNVEKLTRFVKKKEQKEYIDKQLKAFRKATSGLKAEKKIVEEELDAKKKESLFLSKAVSTDKEIILNLNHTIENSTLEIKEAINEINENIKENKPIKSIAPLVDEISIENEKIKTLSGIVSLANFNLKVEWITKDIVTYIEEYLQKFKTKILKFKFINSSIKHATKFRPLEISIVLDNFVSNSKKAGATEITFLFKEEDGELHVLVGDNGKGIKDQDSKHIFKRGFTTTDGAGIGLAHIKNIIESMGDQIEFKGNNIELVGKGACFEMVFK